MNIIRFIFLFLTSATFGQSISNLIKSNIDGCCFLAKVEVCDERTNVTKNVFGPFPIYCN